MAKVGGSGFDRLRGREHAFGRLARFAGGAGNIAEHRHLAQYARAKVGWAQSRESDEPKPSVKVHINELYAKAGITDRTLSNFPAAGASSWNRLPHAKPT